METGTTIDLNTLLERIRQYHKNGSLDMVRHAYAYAEEKHRGQVRKSGEPYTIHPVNVAYILTDMELDIQSICAALLHDVVEDTDATREDLVRDFGETVGAGRSCSALYRSHWLL